MTSDPDTKATTEPYRGDQPYVFVSYAHADRDRVLPVVASLQKAGFRVWFDEGILGGEDWADAIGRAVKGCAAFVSFLSRVAAASSGCRDEVTMALNRDKRVVVVHLEDTDLPDGLELRLAKTQAILRYRLLPAAFEAKLHRALPEEARAAQEKRPPVSGSARSEIRIGASSVVISSIPPSFQVDAIVHEEDTYQVLSADTDLILPTEHPLRTLNRARDAEPARTGTVVVMGERPVVIHAIVDDLSAQPICRPEWVKEALEAVVAVAAHRRLTSLCLPVLGTEHGHLPHAVAIAMIRAAFEVTRHPLKVWLRVARGAETTIAAELSLVPAPAGSDGSRTFSETKAAILEYMRGKPDIAWTLDRLAALLAGHPRFAAATAAIRPALAALIEEGYLTSEEGRLRATERAIDLYRRENSPPAKDP
jgi:hypothetical protein